MGFISHANICICSSHLDFCTEEYKASDLWGKYCNPWKKGMTSETPIIGKH